MSRPSDYTEEIVLTICDRISDGESLRSICRDDAMPDKRTVLKWLAIHPEFVTQYAQAREAQADALADEITDIADDGTRDYVMTANGPIVNQDHIARSRLRVDARKWIASKLKPKKYGDKVETTHVGDKERPIVVSQADVDL